MKSKILILLLLVNLFSCVKKEEKEDDLVVEKDPILVSAVQIPSSYDLAYSAVIGLKFTVAEAIKVKALGAINPVGSIMNPDDGQIDIDGLTGEIPVGLYNASGELITQKTISANSLLVGDFRYEALAESIDLQAGTYYLIAVFESDEYFAYKSNTPAVLDSRLTFVSVEQAPSTDDGSLPATPPGNTQNWSDEYYAASLLIEE